MGLFVTRCFLLAISLCALSRAEEVDTCPADSCNQPGSHIPEDETLVCNIGSACREEYLAANGSETEIWPDATIKVNMDRIRTEKNRLRLNKYQPALVPKYTEFGYKKEKMPESTFEQLMAWYEVVAPRRPLRRESWTTDNTYVNHWKLDTYMMHSTQGVQQRLFNDLQPLMEDWVGVPLKPSACYGVRVYHRGSVLANHVDRIDTHVVSGIINVDQTNLDSEWPLYVRGHDGVARNITIQPGEIIFYESASVIHGRPTPFEGEAFANIFVHFAPVEGWSITAADVDKASRADRVARASFA